MKPSPYGPLLIDRRIGSSDLYPLLQRHGVPCELTDLSYGDVSFLGRGPGDEPIPIGIERKRLNDLVSSLLSARLNGHQLPGMLKAYKLCWIVVEGTYRADDDGALIVPRRGGWGRLGLGRQGFMVESLEAWLLTVALRGGARVMHTRDDEHTARWLGALYKWWTQKTWDEHSGHLALDHAVPEHDAMMLVRPNLVQRWAAELPGIGYQKAMTVRQMFPTGLALACAPMQQWKTIVGIGDGIARNVVKLIQEGE